MLVEVCFELVCCIIEKGISVLSDYATEIILIQLGLLLSNTHKTQKLITDLINTPVYDVVLNFSDATEHIINKSGMYADYLKRCISQTRIVLSNPSSKIKNIILALELRVLSQIFIGEPVEVVRKPPK